MLFLCCLFLWGMKWGMLKSRIQTLNKMNMFPFLYCYKKSHKKRHFFQVSISQRTTTIHPSDSLYGCHALRNSLVQEDMGNSLIILLRINYVKRIWRNNLYDKKKRAYAPFFLTLFFFYII